MNNCLECGSPLSHVEGRKKKMFCNQVCKGKYWRKNNPPKKENKTVKIIEEILMSEKGIELISEIMSKIANKSKSENRKLNTSDVPKILTETNKPEKVKGESTIDYALRLAEWKEKNK